MSRFSAQPTPNPNSLKLVRTDGGTFLASGMVSCTRVEQAAEHPLAALLFGIPGVAGLFAMPPFLTITREPGTAWDDLLPVVEAALDDYLDS